MSAARAHLLCLVGVGVVLVAACAPPQRAPATGVAPSQHTGPGAAPNADASGESDDGEDPGGDEEDRGATFAEASRCPPDMAEVEGYCVDRYEASLVEIMHDGTERPYPHYAPVDGKDVRAVSVPGAYPQGFISEVQAADACAASGKRLCTHTEWKTACKGPAHTTFPYGEKRATGVCNDDGRSAVLAVFGAKAVLASAIPASTLGGTQARRTATGAAVKKAHVLKGRAAKTTRERPTRGDRTTTAAAGAAARSHQKGDPRKKTRGSKKARMSVRPAAVEASVWTKLNDPRLGQVEGALAKTGDHPGCENPYGLYDMVGNLHEWVATSPSLPNGTFAGGYYLDTSQNGDGCNYRTVAHAHDYHDYSTGFRCCADTLPSAEDERATP